MSFEFIHDSNNNILIVKINELLSIEELKKAARILFQSGDIPYDINTIYDLQEMDFSNINAEFGEKLILFRQSLNRGNAKIACVTSTDLGFGLGRMYEAMSDQLQQRIRIFRSMDEAKAWLI